MAPGTTDQLADTQAAPRTTAPPTISLPKGGGAIRGIGEKLSANPVTGTGSLSVPIAVSPGRAGFGPQLALHYDSGAGNGPFGLGWSLDLPAISRKTDKGLPQYNDASESDVFLLSGAEDLVPAFRLPADGTVLRDTEYPSLDESEHDGHRIRRYRPRVEGLFARIERWTRTIDGDVHWRSISRDNLLTVYGLDQRSRIADPADPRRVFNWLICETRDDRGNAIVYEYQPEDSRRVDLSQAHEAHRGGRDSAARRANRYLKRIKYGNQASLLDDANRRPQFLTEEALNAAGWMFEVLFDYGEGHCQSLLPDPTLPDRHEYVTATTTASAWALRQDPFSAYRAGFELRTYRLCRRILMFHHFASELDAADCLIRSTDLDYAEDGPASFITRVSQSGYVRQPADGITQRYLRSSLPPLEFDYSAVPTAAELARQPIREATGDELENLPHGLDGSRHRFVDLDGEGLSGLLSEHAGAWFYKRNLSPLESTLPTRGAKFAAQEPLASLPAGALGGAAHQLLDLAGDGQLELVDFDRPAPGFYERTVDADWSPFQPFTSLPTLDWQDPNMRFVDLTGDGLADILVTEDEVLSWYPGLGEAGFAPGRKVHARDAEGPRLVFAEATQSLYLADMSGDGLSDLVRLRNGEVCYWPNLGYGRFGAKVCMDDAPWFDEPDLFDQRRIRLADLDGSGVVDIVYLGRRGATLYYNRAGNGWSDGLALPQFPRLDNLASVQLLDLLGNGTACLVWSSSLPADAARPARYLDLMGGNKPHLLVRMRNNLGAETQLEYAPSTRFYLEDKYTGVPWITRLPFPVHCVERITVTDRWRQTSFSTRYSYHHGYFDGQEREFRGFGRVEQVDVESYGQFAGSNAASPYIAADRTLYQPPVKTVTWFHTGAAIDRSRVLSQFAHEYFPLWFEAENPERRVGGFAEKPLPEPDLRDLTPEEWREALRACKGMPLRQEVYELDVEALAEGVQRPVKLFSVASHNADIQRIQPQAAQRHAVFLVTESETLTYQHELDLRDDIIAPDPRVSHSLTLRTDRYGQPLQGVTVTYPRAGRFEDGTLSAGDLARIRAVQQELHLGYAESRYTNDIDDAHAYRLRLPCESLTCELSGIAPRGRYFDLDELRAFRLSPVHQRAGTEVEEIGYHQRPTAGAQKRTVEHTRSLFFHDDLAQPLRHGALNARALPFETYTLALTEALLAAIFVDKLTADVRGVLNDASTSGYLGGAALARRFPAVPTAGEYWHRSGIAGFAADAARHFFLPERYTDPFGHVTTLEYDARDLFVQSSADARGNTARVTQFDYRVLSPRETEDPNGNRSEVAFDALGLATALAQKGKGREGDALDMDAVLLDPPPSVRAAFFTSARFDEAQARSWLGNATARHVYHFGEQRHSDGTVIWGVQPACACAVLREQHVSRLAPGETSPLQAAFAYTDGLGSVIVRKMQAEPEADGAPLRWIASGKTVLNNKGKPVKQYEPYFSESGHAFEEPREVGVTPVIYYDAAGRTVRTEAPDGAYARVAFSPWHVAHHDANDTVLEPGNSWYAARRPLDPSRPLPADPVTGALRATPAQRAAWLAAQHARTPSVTVLDSLGRAVVAIAHNRTPDERGVPVEAKHLTVTTLDAEGKPLWIRDARGNLVMQYVRQRGDPATPVSNTVEPGDYTPAYDIAGNLLFQHSMDAGDRWMLNDAAGKPMLAWDFNAREEDGGTVAQRRYFTEYDALHRPTAQWLGINDEPRKMIDRFEYRDIRQTDGTGNPRLAEDRAANLLGQLVRRYDSSGLVETVRRDFKGNMLETRRKLANAYDAPVIDWSAGSPTARLEAETWTQVVEYDALNRMTRQYGWHGGAGSRVAVYEPRYNARGLLASEELVLRATRTDSGYAEGPEARRTAAVRAIAYDAKGQRQRIEHGNRTVTRYQYDPQTFRLLQLRTTRPGADPRFPAHRAGLRDDAVLQQLHYTYDPAGNITEIEDEAYEPGFFRNQRVEPRSRYAYDALYRLVEATGRESATMSPPAPIERGAVAAFPLAAPGTLRNYTQRYRYDAVGNIEEMRHSADRASWTRHYAYAADSNRLLRSWTGSDDTDAVRYGYDAHGSMLNLANVPEALRLRWDHRDMIEAVDLGGGGIAHYQYDAAKERSRKVIVNRAGATQWERLYLGGMEVYRRYGASGVVEEIETHPLMLGDRRVLLVEDVLVTPDADLGTGPRFRYQYDDHLGSSCVELDADARIVACEAYHPYGTSAYQLARSAAEANLRRYRYTGKEHDGETGLNYHSARYYAPWLGRWVSTDPVDIKDGVNAYLYAKASSTNFIDHNGKQALAAQRTPHRSSRPFTTPLGIVTTPLATAFFRSRYIGSIEIVRESQMQPSYIVRILQAIPNRTIPRYLTRSFYVDPTRPNEIQMREPVLPRGVLAPEWFSNIRDAFRSQQFMVTTGALHQRPNRNWELTFDLPPNMRDVVQSVSRYSSLTYNEDLQEPIRSDRPQQGQIPLGITYRNFNMIMQAIARLHPEYAIAERRVGSGVLTHYIESNAQSQSALSATGLLFPLHRMSRPPVVGLGLIIAANRVERGEFAVPLTNGDFINTFLHELAAHAGPMATSRSDPRHPGSDASRIQDQIDRLIPPSVIDSITQVADPRFRSQ